MPIPQIQAISQKEIDGFLLTLQFKTTKAGELFEFGILWFVELYSTCSILWKLYKIVIWFIIEMANCAKKWGNVYFI